MDKIEVTQWRKKPVVVEAMKYPGHTITGVDTLLAFEGWIEPLAKAAGRWPLTYRGQSLIIPTLEGDHEAKPGDYIIRGVSGEIYPCKPDIFAKTYEPAHAPQSVEPVAWMPIDSAPTKPTKYGSWSGPSILTIGTDQPGLVTETRYLDPGPFVRTDNGSYHKPAGWYWAGWDGAVGPINPTHWQPLPAAPDATNPHPPATDVAALVAAAKACQAQFTFYATEHLNAHKHEKAKTNQRFADMLYKALAPFTKGQDDE